MKYLHVFTFKLYESNRIIAPKKYFEITICSESKIVTEDDLEEARVKARMKYGDNYVNYAFLSSVLINHSVFIKSEK